MIFFLEKGKRSWITRDGRCGGGGGGGVGGGGGGGCQAERRRRVCYVYIRRRRAVRAWRVRACKTVLYAGHNNSPRFGSRSKGGAVAGIMVGGGRLYTRRGLRGEREREREPTFGRVYIYIAVGIRI